MKPRQQIKVRADPGVQPASTTRRARSPRSRRRCSRSTCRSSRRRASRACRSCACRRSSTAPTSARRRTSAGTTPPRRCPARRSSGCSRYAQEVPDGDGRPGLRARAWPASTTTPPPCSTPTARYLGKYRKNHIPQTNGFWEKYFFKPGQPRLPGVPDRATRKIGVYICYDRHFPEGARLLGLHGAEIVFNPSATVAGLSQYLWKLEQPAHAVANGYFMAASTASAPRRRGTSASSTARATSSIRAAASSRTAARTRTSWSSPSSTSTMIEEVRRTWQFYRDRRPETYEDLTRQLP